MTFPNPDVRLVTRYDAGTVSELWSTEDAQEMLPQLGTGAVTLVRDRQVGVY